jgi:hypothetical protein
MLLLVQLGSMPHAPLWHAPPAVYLPKKTVFDLSVNAMKPLLYPNRGGWMPSYPEPRQNERNIKVEGRL